MGIITFWINYFKKVLDTLSMIPEHDFYTNTWCGRSRNSRWNSIFKAIMQFPTKMNIIIFKSLSKVWDYILCTKTRWFQFIWCIWTHLKPRNKAFKFLLDVGDQPILAKISFSKWFCHSNLKWAQYAFLRDSLKFILVNNVT